MKTTTDYQIKFDYKGKTFDLLIDFTPQTYGSMDEPPMSFELCQAVFNYDGATAEEVSELEKLSTDDEDFLIAVESAVLNQESDRYEKWSESQNEN